MIVQFSTLAHYNFNNMSSCKKENITPSQYDKIVKCIHATNK
jgi:hypothetical protein